MNTSSLDPHEEQGQLNIPFFRDEDASSISQSDCGTDSSRGNSLLDRSLSFFTRRDSRPKHGPEMSKLKAFMSVWSNFKPNLDQDCLPYNDILTGNDPFMSLSSCRLRCDSSFSNLIALLVNSVRREIADMSVYILPGLIERSTEELSIEDCAEFQAWWRGFAEYVFVVFMTVAKALSMQYKDAGASLGQLQRDKRRDLTREYYRCVERLTVTSELPMKAMREKVQVLLERRTAGAVVDVDDTWSCLTNFTLQALDDSFHVAKSIEAKLQTPMPQGLQEKILQSMVTRPRHVHAGVTQNLFFSNVIVSLCRWMKDESTVMEFINRFFKKKVARDMELHVVQYASQREICKFQFDKKPHCAPRKTGHRPSKVKFSFE